MKSVTRRNALLGATSLAAAPALGSVSPIGLAPSAANAQTVPVGFPGGFPAPEIARRLYDEADLNRAILAYKFFYSNISMAGLAAAFEKFTPVENKAFFML